MNRRVILLFLQLFIGVIGV